MQIRTSHILLVTLLAACGGKQQPTEKAPVEPSSPLVAACEAGTANSCLIAGNDAEKAGEIEEAARLYDLACALTDASGCALAGGAFADAGDLTATAKSFEAGCALDDGTSCFGRGLLAAGSFGGDPDWAAALGPYEKACNLGLAAGCGELANLVGVGRGTEVDLERAAALRKQACGQGDGESCTRLGLEAWRDKRVSEAKDLFEKGCGTELPDPDGCGYFGWLLWSDDKEPDEARGIAMLDAACEADSAAGCAMRANVHARLGDVEAGKKSLARACELDATSCAAMSQQFEAAQAPGAP